MTTVLMAATVAASFGVANFIGGIASRRAAALAVTANAHLLGAALLGGAVLLFPARHATLADVTWGGVAGVTGGFAVVALYAALAHGRMSVVAPLTAAISAALPALYDVASGTVLRPISGLGITIALVAVIIVSASGDTESRAAMPLRAVVLAVAAGVGFSVTLIAYSFSGAESGFVPLAAARIVSSVLLGALTLIRSRSYLVAADVRGFTFGSGAIEAFANIALITALRTGPLAIVAVLAAMHPVVTILLARGFLGERLQGVQRAGVALALVAVVMTALP
ncbi:MAG: EamA family transporter [Coriobacteriia bacterium]|nr:EamA family transporter [Coriobacteriia bacterium]